MTLKVALVGAGGYAASYVTRLFEPKIAELLSLTAVIDPMATASLQYDRFKHLPIYNRLEDFFAAGNKADLVIISSPIQLHYQHAMAAMAGGAHVLCEKPLVPTLAQLDSLAETAKSTDKVLAVGFQLSYASAVLNIKERYIAGEFGKAISLKAIVSWCKEWEYYARNNWAGKLEVNGLVVNDAVASNATAHYIHNMLFVLGDKINTAAPLTGLQAECYRANNIETFDTIALRGQAGGADVFYTATHAGNGDIQPRLEYTFEKVKIVIDFANYMNPCKIYHSDGQVEEMTLDMHDGEANKIILTAENIQGNGVPLCDVNTARPITALLDAIFANVPFIDIPREFVTVDTGERHTYVTGLEADMQKCFDECKLPSEIGFDWAMG